MRTISLHKPVPVQLDENGVLVCPSCGNSFTHQNTVTVFLPEQEDASTGMHVHVEGEVVGTIKIDSDLTGNPSPRRQGLLVGFGCEGCTDKPVLSIIQHKGQTFVEWLRLVV